MKAELKETTALRNQKDIGNGDLSIVDYRHFSINCLLSSFNSLTVGAVPSLATVYF